MSKHRLRLIVLLLATVWLAACATGSGMRAVPKNASLPPPDSTNTAGAYEGATEYRLGSNDLIEVSVFGVDELSKTVRVNSNGMISLPLVGSVMAGGRTIPELNVRPVSVSRKH